MRDRIEAALGRWGLFVSAHAGWIVLAVFVSLGLLGTQIQYFRIETSNEDFFHRDDPIRVQYESFSETFGRDSAVAIALRPEGGIFESGFLETLRAIHRAIEEEVPYVVEVTSLWNVRETVGTETGLEVGELLEDWPETEAALRVVEARARANPLYRNFLFSEDGGTTMIVIETEAFSPTSELDALGGFDEAPAEEGPGLRTLITGDEDRAVVLAVEAILDRHRSEDLEVHLSGMPPFAVVVSRTMMEDMGRFTVLSIAVIALLLYLLFRRIMAVVITLLTVGLSVFATLSLMGAVDIPMMPPSQIIPTFLLAVGVGGAVHLLAIFFQGLASGLAKPEAIAHALSHSGLAIIMASLTTAGGLISFIPAALAPISHFGLITPFGVLLSLALTLALLPALLALLPIGAPPANEGEDAVSASQRALLAVGRFATDRSGVVLVVWALLLGAAMTGLPQLRLGHDMLDWFPDEDPMRQSTLFLNDHFGGASSYEILVDTGKENGLHEPEVLRRIESAVEIVEQHEASGLVAGKIVSILDIVKETHRALNENRPEAYAIPDSRALVSQELLLFENSGSDDVEDMVTSDFSTARVSVRLPFSDGAFFTPYMDSLVPRLESALGPDLGLEIAGMYRLMGNTTTAALTTLVRSYATAILVITLLMILLIGRVRLGFVSMIPNLAPVVLVLGLMGWLDVQLDMFTLMLGSIVIGLAVDDTIHFMHNYRRAYDETRDPREAVARTLAGTGQALLFTSCVLASGFLIYTQAYMEHLFAFGVLTASAIVAAFLADITLAPALVSSLGERLARSDERLGRGEG